MKTTIDIVDILWKLLNSNSSLTTDQKGKRYKHSRPVGSTGEDIVINSLPVDNNLLQQALANVNVYAGNQSVTMGAAESQEPDTKRLNMLAKKVITIINDHYDLEKEIGFDVQQMVLINDEQTGEWYYNIRVTTYNLN
jgi:hypothetical protein